MAGTLLHRTLRHPDIRRRHLLPPINGAVTFALCSQFAYSRIPKQATNKLTTTCAVKLNAQTATSPPGQDAECTSKTRLVTSPMTDVVPTGFKELLTRALEKLIPPGPTLHPSSQFLVVVMEIQ